MSIASVELPLERPALPPRHVSRTRLITALNDAGSGPLTLLSAGPGTGKTVLLTDWSMQVGEGVAWILLRPSDDEPRRFWRLLGSALYSCGALARPPSSGPACNSARSCIDAIRARPTDSPTPPAVVIDDAHMLTDPRVLDGLDEIIRMHQPRVRLVLAARSDPLLPLHRYRLDGRISELRATDLAMTSIEAQRVLAAHGVELDNTDLDRLLARTEGWTAGIRLSAIRMEGAERPGDFVSELALDQGSVGEYLTNEVLRKAPDPVQQLLIRTSFLDEVSGSLADAITGMQGSADRLAELARTNSFVIPLDRSWTVYRYHQQFAEILRFLLQRQARETPPTELRAAANWYEAHGDLDSALRWAARARDIDKVIDLLTHGALAHAFVHRQDLSDCGLGGAARDAPPAQGRIDWRMIEAAADDQDQQITADLARLVMGQRNGDSYAVQAAADRLLDVGFGKRPEPVPGLAAAVLLAAASARLWDGRFEDLDRMLDEALRLAERAHAVGIELEVLGMRALHEMYRCRPRRAADASTQAHALLGQHPELDPPTALNLAEALGSVIGADPAGVASALQHTVISEGVGVDPGLAGALALVEAWLLLRRGRVGEAQTVLRSSAACAPRAFLAVQCDLLLADCELAVGRPQAALQQLDTYRQTRFAECVAPALARTHLALGNFDAAERCTRSVLTGTSPQVSRYQVIEAILCEAQIALQDGNAARAIDGLVRGIDIADGDVVLPFLGATEPLTDLLQRHAAVAAEWPVPIAAAHVDADQAATDMSPDSLLEPLTNRERTIIRFLATTMSTAEIADELCISVNTVKTHLAAIYRKLAARRRRDAVYRARELELL